MIFEAVKSLEIVYMNGVCLMRTNHPSRPVLGLVFAFFLQINLLFLANLTILNDICAKKKKC